jgi:hypothetical protein
MAVEQESPIGRSQAADDTGGQFNLPASQTADFLRWRSKRAAGAYVIVFAAAGAIIAGQAHGTERIASGRDFLILLPVQIRVEDCSEFIILHAHKSLA